MVDVDRVIGRLRQLMKYFYFSSRIGGGCKYRLPEKIFGH